MLFRNCCWVVALPHIVSTRPYRMGRRRRQWCLEKDRRYCRVVKVGWLVRIRTGGGYGGIYGDGAGGDVLERLMDFHGKP